MYLVFENGVLKESTELDVLGREAGNFNDYAKDFLYPAGFSSNPILSTSASLEASLQVYGKADERSGTSKFKFLVDYDMGDSYIHTVGVSSELELHYVLSIVMPIVAGMAMLEDIENNRRRRLS